MLQVGPLSDLGVTYDQLEEICYGLRKAYVNIDGDVTVEMSIIPQSLFSTCSFGGQSVSSLVSTIQQNVQMQDVSYCAIATGASMCFLFNEQSYLMVG
jgi:hypothetical protein